MAEDQAKEEGASGGGRDPKYFSDFYDVWTHPVGNPDPDKWEGDRSITLFGDIFGVAFRFGATHSLPYPKEDALADALVPPDDEDDGTGYHAAFDRGAQIGPNVWDRAPPDSTIDLFNDIFGVMFQFGHDCTQQSTPRTATGPWNPEPTTVESPTRGQVPRLEGSKVPWS